MVAGSCAVNPPDGDRNGEDDGAVDHRTLTWIVISNGALTVKEGGGRSAAMTVHLWWPDRRHDDRPDGREQWVGSVRRDDPACHRDGGRIAPISVGRTFGETEGNACALDHCTLACIVSPMVPA